MHLIRRCDPHLSLRVTDDLTVVELRGELDIVLAQHVRPELDTLSRECPALTVDLRPVTFCDASGLDLLARCAQRIRKRGARWSLLCDQRTILRLIRLTSLDELLDPVPGMDPTAGTALTHV